MIDTRSLVEFGELGAKLIAGKSGASRPVTWAHVSELADPTPWLDGGELIMTTGLGVPRMATDQTEYICRLDQAGAAGLAIGEDMFAPPLSRAMLAKADELAFPVLSVRRDIPFASLAQRVAIANRDSLHQSMALHLRVLEIARRVAEQAVAPLDVIASLSAVTNFELYPVSLRGEPLFEGGARGPIAVAPDEVTRLGTEVRPIPIQTSGTAPTFLLPIVVREYVVGAMVAISRHRLASRLLVLEHVVTIVSLLARDVLETRERDRLVRSAAFAALLPDGSAADLLPQASGSALVLYAGAVDDTAWAGAHHHLAAFNAEYALGGSADSAWVVAAGRPSDLVVLVEGASRYFENSIAGVSTQASVSAPLAELRVEALTARRHALLRGERLVQFDRRLAGTSLEQDAIEVLAHQVLRPLIEHDRKADVSLLGTLRVFLESNRSWKQASQRLGIHRQTLIHRVRRIEELTRRNLHATDDVAVIWLALQAIGDDGSGPSHDLGKRHDR